MNHDLTASAEDLHRKLTFSMHVPTHVYSRTRGSMQVPGEIVLVERDLKVSRLTATKYLEVLAGGFVQKVKLGRANYYINQALNAILTRAEMVERAQRS